MGTYDHMQVLNASIEGLCRWKNNSRDGGWSYIAVHRKVICGRYPPLQTPGSPYQT